MHLTFTGFARNVGPDVSGLPEAGQADLVSASTIRLNLPMVTCLSLPPACKMLDFKR